MMIQIIGANGIGKYLHGLNQEDMKKLSVIVILFLSIGLVSCGEEGDIIEIPPKETPEDHPIVGTWLYDSHEDTCGPDFLVTPIGVYGSLLTFRADGTYLFIDEDRQEFTGTYTVFEDTLTFGVGGKLKFTVENDILSTVHEYGPPYYDRGTLYTYLHPVKSTLMKKLLIILLASCTTTFQFDEWDITYPPELEPQIQLWKEYAPDGLKYKRLTIQLTGEVYASDGRKVAGRTIRRKHLIKLDTNSIEYKRARKMLVLHELAHYVLDRPHKDGLFTEGVWDASATRPQTRVNFPISLMVSRGGLPSDHDLNKPSILDYYMTELFNN